MLDTYNADGTSGKVNGGKVFSANGCILLINNTGDIISSQQEGH